MSESHRLAVSRISIAVIYFNFLLQNQRSVVISTAVKSSQDGSFCSHGPEKPKQLLSISPKAIKHHFRLKGFVFSCCCPRMICAVMAPVNRQEAYQSGFMGICG